MADNHPKKRRRRQPSSSQQQQQQQHHPPQHQHPPQHYQQQQVPWETRFFQLQQFKAQFGHANPCWDARGSPAINQLACWLQHQRSFHAQGIRYLTPVQIQLLWNLGCSGFDGPQLRRPSQGAIAFVPTSSHYHPQNATSPPHLRNYPQHQPVPIVPKMAAAPPPMMNLSLASIATRHQAQVPLQIGNNHNNPTWGTTTSTDNNNTQLRTTISSQEIQRTIQPASILQQVQAQQQKDGLQTTGALQEEEEELDLDQLLGEDAEDSNFGQQFLQQSEGGIPTATSTIEENPLFDDDLVGDDNDQNNTVAETIASVVCEMVHSHNKAEMTPSVPPEAEKEQAELCTSTPSPAPVDAATTTIAQQLEEFQSKAGILSSGPITAEAPVSEEDEAQPQNNQEPTAKKDHDDKEQINWDARCLELRSLKDRVGHTNPAAGSSLFQWVVQQQVVLRQGKMPLSKAQRLREIDCPGFEHIILEKTQPQKISTPTVVASSSSPAVTRGKKRQTRQKKRKRRNNDKAKPTVAVSSAVDEVASEASTANNNDEEQSDPNTDDAADAITIWEDEEQNAVIGIPWMGRFLQLKAFKEEHGHTTPSKSKSVPEAERKLSLWLKNQRCYFRKGAKKLPPERAKMLQGLGCWGFQNGHHEKRTGGNHKRPTTPTAPRNTPVRSSLARNTPPARAKRKTTTAPPPAAASLLGFQNGHHEKRTASKRPTAISTPTRNSTPARSSLARNTPAARAKRTTTAPPPAAASLLEKLLPPTTAPHNTPARSTPARAKRTTTAPPPAAASLLEEVLPPTAPRNTPARNTPARAKRTTKVPPPATASLSEELLPPTAPRNTHARNTPRVKRTNKVPPPATASLLGGLLPPSANNSTALAFERSFQTLTYKDQNGNLTVDI